jgi:hypothetical protein
MTTGKKVLSNRLNAQRSTGPRSMEGRRQSSTNAIKHGLTSRQRLVPASEAAVHQTFCDRIIADAQPEGAIEKEYARLLAHDLWQVSQVQRLKKLQLDQIVSRATRVHTQAGFEPEKERVPLFDEFHLHCLDLLARYDARARRESRSDFHELQRLQAKRKGEPVVPPIPIDLNVAAVETPAAPEQRSQGQAAQGPIITLEQSDG